MALRVIKASDPLKVSHIVMLVYGQPGVRKTSLGFTASKPILLDFDKGAHRAYGRKDVVQFNSFAEAEAISEEDVAGYESMIIDPAGKMAELLSFDLCKDPKNVRKGSQELSIQGYGILRKRVTAILNKWKSWGKDIIILCHDQEEKRGDDLIVRPDILGGAKKDIQRMADMIGYMHMRDKRVIAFDPSSEYIGKNCTQIPVWEVPDFSVAPNYLANLLNDVKEAINSESELMREKRVWLNEQASKITELVDSMEFISYYETLGAMNLSGTDKVYIGNALNEKAPELGLVFNKEKKSWLSALASQTSINTGITEQTIQAA